MFFELFEASARLPVWRFRGKNVPEMGANATLIGEHTETRGKLAIETRRYTVTGGKATRILVSTGENFAMMTEYLTFDEPRCVYTSFVWRAFPDLSCNVADKNRLVFRAGGRGAKLFRLACVTDGVNTLANSGLLLPDGFSEDGAVRITPYAGLYSFGCEQLTVLAIAEDADARVKGWHMTTDGSLEIIAPDKSPRLRAVIDGACMIFTAPDTGDGISQLLVE